MTTQLVKTLMNRDIEPFDILFRNFFDNNTFFSPLSEVKPKYPVDIYETDEGVQFDIAVVGLCEKDINIEIKDGDTLYVSYNKEQEESEETKTWIQRGIAKRAFSFGWKIGNKFDLNQIDATIDNGLLSIKVPASPQIQPKQIEIKNLKALKSKNK